MLLKQYLSENNITARRFGELLGISRSFTSSLVNGLKKPSLETMYLIEHHTQGKVTIKEMVEYFWERNNFEKEYWSQFLKTG